MRHVLSIDTIVSDPLVGSGRPSIAGTIVKVSDIAIHHIFWGQTIDEIAAQLGLSMSQVHAALAFYYEYQEDIDAEIDGRDQMAGEQETLH